MIFGYNYKIHVIVKKWTFQKFINIIAFRQWKTQFNTSKSRRSGRSARSTRALTWIQTWIPSTMWSIIGSERCFSCRTAGISTGHSSGTNRWTRAALRRGHVAQNMRQFLVHFLNLYRIQYLQKFLEHLWAFNIDKIAKFTVFFYVWSSFNWLRAFQLLWNISFRNFEKWNAFYPLSVVIL